MKTSKKLLSILLCCMMAFGLIPMAASAAEPVSSIDLTVNGYGIGKPMADASITANTQGISVTPVGGWLDKEYEEVAGQFERGTLYCHYVRLKAQDGYSLPSITDENIKSLLTVNGKTPAYAWAWDPEADGSVKILFFMDALSEQVDSLSLNVNHLAVGKTWAESNVTVASGQVFVQNAKLIYKGVISDHDILVTDPLKAHTPYQLYLYIWTENGYHFDINSLQNDDVSILVNGQNVTPAAIRDGGDNGRSIVMDVDMPLLHTYGDYQYDETKHWQECQDADCPDKEESIQSSTASHRFGEWTEVKAPTQTETGIKERACSFCGYTESAEIPVIQTGTTTEPTPTPGAELPEIPKTGEEARTSLWAILLLMGGIGAVMLGRQKASNH